MMAFLRQTVALALVTCVLSANPAKLFGGVLSEWTQRGGDAGHSSYVSGSLGSGQFRLAWEQSLDSTQYATAVGVSGTSLFRVVADNASSGNFHVQSVELSTGGMNWSTSVAKGPSFTSVTAPTIAGGKVWVNRGGHSGISGGTFANDPKIYSFDAGTGAISSVTGYAAQWGEFSRPVTDGTVLIAEDGYYGGMSSYRVSDGGRSWNISGQQNKHPLPTLTDDYIFAWDNLIYDRDGNFVQSIGTGHNAPIVSGDGTLIYRISNGIAAYDAETLAPLWQTSLGAYASAVAAGNGLVAVAVGNTLQILDEVTGAVNGTYTAPGNLGREIALSDSEVFVQLDRRFASDPRMTIGVDLQTLNEIGRLEDSGAMAIADDYLLISFDDGTRAYDMTTVPEPSAFLLCGMLMGLACWLRRGGCSPERTAS